MIAAPGVYVGIVMGRHAGWIAAAGGLAAERDGESPHIILFPEIAFDKEKFLAKVKETARAQAKAVAWGGWLWTTALTSGRAL